MSLIPHTGMTSQILVRDIYCIRSMCLHELCQRKCTKSLKNWEKKIDFMTVFCFTAKNLVASLMDVDQDQRLTAQEAIAHEW